MEDRSVLLQKEGSLDLALQLISSGKTEYQVSESLSIPQELLMYALTRNNAVKKNFLAAKLFYSANKGMEVLVKISKKKHLEVEQKNAASHHIKMSEVALKALTDDTSQGTSITVINNVISSNSTPDLPKHLEDLV